MKVSSSSSVISEDNMLSSLTSVVSDVTLLARSEFTTFDTSESEEEVSSVSISIVSF